MQRHIESAPRTFFDERTQRSRIEIHAPHLLYARINPLQILVAKLDKVIETKILLRQ